SSFGPNCVGFTKTEQTTKRARRAASRTSERCPSWSAPIVGTKPTTSPCPRATSHAELTWVGSLITMAPFIGWHAKNKTHPTRAPSCYAVCGRLAVRGLFLGGTALALVLGCGSRGPLDDSPFEHQLDAGSADAIADAGTEADAGPKLSGLPACGVCILSTCS